MVLSCDKCLMSCCWGRSSRGCDHLLPWELDPGNKRLLTPPLPLEYAFGLLFPLPEAAPRILPRDDNEVLRLPGWYMWLNSVEASVLTFKIWVVRVENYLFCGHPKQACEFPCFYETCRLPVCSGLLLSSVSSCPRHKGDDFRSHMGSFWGFHSAKYVC